MKQRETGDTVNAFDKALNGFASYFLCLFSLLICSKLLRIVLIFQEFSSYLLNELKKNNKKIHILNADEFNYNLFQ